ncbi:MAG: TetR/AcrR family transcriptional regulator [Alphaproteobacteria bacterium]|nr:MAG: TetR/AcrR family transcriptional regulator [Alphaproteobacteria bacterium]
MRSRRTGSCNMAEPRKRKRAVDRRAEIVETALRLAAEVGPDRVTTQRLADAIGITQPAIFRHFPSKAAIWEAVAERIVADLAHAHRHGQESVAGKDPLDRLRHLVTHHFHHISKNPAVPAILFSSELHAAHPELREKFAALLAERRAGFAAMLREAEAAGLHRAGLVVEDAAHLVMATIHGLSARWILEGRGFDLVEEGGRIVSALVESFRP